MQTEKNHTKMQQNTFYNKLIFKIKVGFLWAAIKLLYGLNRFAVEGMENITKLSNKNESFVMVSWHGKILSVFHYFSNKNYIGLASLNKDAELIAQVGELVGYSFVRGSSSKGGADAYSDMIRLLKIPGTKIIITPDGPQGPEHIPKPGAIRLAQKTGVPIVPVIGHAKRSWVFKNWHNFYLSKPFSPIKLVVGDPLYFKPDDELDFCIKQLKEKLDIVDKRASTHD